MILRRLGNKSKIAKKIQQHFPPHKIYIEPFFGAAGMFFNKPKAHCNILNDLDSDVFNLFDVIIHKKEELIGLFKIMPKHSDLFEYWKYNKEIEPIKKALRFLFLSNYTLMGLGGNLRLSSRNDVEQLNLDLKNINDFMFEVQFSNFDFRELFKKISIEDIDLIRTFIYCDPPYLETNDNYSHSFTEADSNDLFDCLQETKCKWSVSEFNHPFILEQANKRNLNIITIGERQNLKNRRIEILITNYINHPTLF